MPPRTRTPSFNPNAEAESKIQELLREAQIHITAAQKVADEAGVRFYFLDKTYVPKTTTTVETGGDWEDELPDWNGSSC